jgi:small subunit ribosomal protein S16
MRMGRKKLPVYRIVVMDARRKRDGRALDFLGTYNPKSKELKLDIEGVKEWLSKGAEMTDRVKALYRLAIKQQEVNNVSG